MTTYFYKESLSFRVLFLKQVRSTSRFNGKRRGTAPNLSTLRESYQFHRDHETSVDHDTRLLRLDSEHIQEG
jgi:hypothetical protein